MSATLAVLFLLFDCVSAASNVQNKQPHIIYAMIDDWGWYNWGVHGNPLARTPVLDQLVSSESLLIERHYTFKYCSPTRRSFLSGRFPPHSGEDNSARSTIDLRMNTIADKLTSVGYASHMSGKWHAGHNSVRQVPTGRGFASSLGYLNGANDHWTQVDKEDGCKGTTTDLWDGHQPGFGMNGTYGDYMYVGRAVDTILKHNASTPLFYYLAMQCAHDPMEAPQRFLDLYDKKIVPDQVEYAFSAVIDEAIGNVTRALKQRGFWDNTIMVITSDNGGPAFSDQHAASNYPLRGGKYTFFEGGLRTNAFVTGGLLPPAQRGVNTSTPMAVCDWYATFCHLAGVDPADNHEGVPPIDSVNQWPAITGVTEEADDREFFLGSGVLLKGQWKLIATGAGAAKWSGPMYPKVPATGPDKIDCNKKACLFDVINDPWERKDVADENGAVLKAMQSRLEELMKGVFIPQQPNVTTADVCKATLSNGHYLTPGDWTATN